MKHKKHLRLSASTCMAIDLIFSGLLIIISLSSETAGGWAGGGQYVMIVIDYFRSVSRINAHFSR